MYLKSNITNIIIVYSFRDLEDTIWPVYKSSAHKGVINSIDGVSGATSGYGAPEIVTGARDGKLYIVFCSKLQLMSLKS